MSDDDSFTGSRILDVEYLHLSPLMKYQMEIAIKKCTHARVKRGEEKLSARRKCVSNIKDYHDTQNDMRIHLHENVNV